MTSGLFLRREDRHELPAARNDLALIEPVIGQFAVTSALHQTGSAQKRQMMGGGWLSDPDLASNIGHGTPMAAAKAHDPLPGRIGNRFTETNPIDRCVSGHGTNI
jgi:hypothetical protein